MGETSDIPGLPLVAGTGRARPKKKAKRPLES